MRATAALAPTFLALAFAVALAACGQTQEVAVGYNPAPECNPTGFWVFAGDTGSTSCGGVTVVSVNADLGVATTGAVTLGPKGGAATPCTSTWDKAACKLVATCTPPDPSVHATVGLSLVFAHGAAAGEVTVDAATCSATMDVLGHAQ